MEQKICKDIHWAGYDPINHTFDSHQPPYPPPPSPMHPFGPPPPPPPNYPDGDCCAHGHMYPPPNPYTAAWYYGFRPWLDPRNTGTAVPGMNYSLYHPDGPLVLGNAFNTGTTLLEVRCESNMSLTLNFSYSDPSQDKSVDLKVGEVYSVSYLENAQLHRCVGKVTDIWKVYGTDNKTSYYKIKIDCSVEYTNKTIIIKNDQIRSLVKYVPHADEDTTLESSVHNFGTTVGMIKNALIDKATVDSNGNLLEGQIIAGEIDGYTLDGIANGTNSKGTQIMVYNGQTYGGVIEKGTIISGVVRGGSTDGQLDPKTNITSKAIVKGATIEAAVIVNTSVKGGKTSKGTFLNAELDGIVYNATITGDDMVTVGGITEGNITTGGTTTGGTGKGGTATGLIDGSPYSIEGGDTNPKSGKKLITTGGVVVGGTIIGGIQSGNVIVGAVVKGGVLTKGTTINGVTTKGVIIPGAKSPIPIAKIDFQNDDRSNLNEAIKKTAPRYLNSDDLLLFADRNTGEISTNLSTAVIERVADIGEVHK